MKGFGGVLCLGAFKVGIVGVRVAVGSPKVYHVGPQLQFEVAQGLVAHAGLQPHARQRVALHRVLGVIFVVAEKSHAVYVDTQLVALVSRNGRAVGVVNK